MGTGLTVTGKLEAGKLQNGDKIVVMPAGEQGLVKGECRIVTKQTFLLDLLKSCCAPFTTDLQCNCLSVSLFHIWFSLD